MLPMLNKVGPEMRLALRIVSQRRVMCTFKETKENWALIDNEEMKKLNLVERSRFNGTHMDTLPQPKGNHALITAQEQVKYNINLFYSTIAIIISIYVWYWADLMSNPNMYEPINLEEAWEEIAARRRAARD